MTQRVVNYTYGTGNPVLPNGSADVRDGIDNLQSLDVFMNAQDDTYNQRDGRIVRTLAGSASVIENIINSSGYNFIGEYSAGLTINSVRDMVRYNGVLYVNSGTLPKTTTGNFSIDGPWVALSSSTGIFLYNFTATAGQTDFSIGAPVVPGTVPIVFRRGVYQQYGSAYNISISDGKVFQFSDPLDAGDEVQIMAMSGADAAVKGDYQAFIYQNSASAPSTPTGENPVGWDSYPTTPTEGQFTFVSTARKNGSDNSLIGAWSAPSRLSGERGISGRGVEDVQLVSKVGPLATYRFLLEGGVYTSTYQVLDGADGTNGTNGTDGADGVSVQQLELVSKVGKTATYRFLLSDATYTNTFEVLDGLDGAGSVVSVNGISPDGTGNVTLTAADVGADPAGTASSAVAAHSALTDPHTQYAFRWANTTDNTGILNTSRRVRWLADTSAARNRTIGDSVTDLLVKDETGQAGTNNITITAPVGKTINGAATEVIDVNYGWVQYTLVGTDFKTIGGQ